MKLRKLSLLILMATGVAFSASSYADEVIYQESDYQSSQSSDGGSGYYYENSNYQPAPYAAPYQGNSYRSQDERYERYQSSGSGSYADRLPQRLATGEKVILIDPRVHAWGAYTPDGTLIRAGLMTAGSHWCADIGRSCRTKSGSFRIQSLGSGDCYSRKYPVGRGGAPMPYCMFFNGGQGIHGSYALGEGNYSHGCVRVSVADAEWLRFDFARIGTRVIVRGY